MQLVLQQGPEGRLFTFTRIFSFRSAYPNVFFKRQCIGNPLIGGFAFLVEPNLYYSLNVRLSLSELETPLCIFIFLERYNVYIVTHVFLDICYCMVFFVSSKMQQTTACKHYPKILPKLANCIIICSDLFSQGWVWQIILYRPVAYWKSCVYFSTIFLTVKSLAIRNNFLSSYREPSGRNNV